VKVQVELSSAEAFKCMLAVKDLSSYDHRIILNLEHQEAYATDGIGCVISPARITITQSVDAPQKEVPTPMVLRITNAKVPRGARGITIIVNDWFDESAMNPIVTSDAQPIGFATVALGASAPNVRRVIHKEHHHLPAAPPRGFNPAAAMTVLKNAASLSKSNYVSSPIKIGSQVAFLWSLEDNGEFVLMGLRSDTDSDRVFWQLVNERSGGNQ
jgi:hypothetical protein